MHNYGNDTAGNLPQDRVAHPSVSLISIRLQSLSTTAGFCLEQDFHWSLCCRNACRPYGPGASRGVTETARTELCGKHEPWRSLAENMNIGGSGTDCKVSFESDDVEARVDHHLLVNGQSKISLITEIKPNPTYISTISVVEIPVCHPLSESQPPDPASLVASSSREGDDKTMSGLHEESENLKEMELPSTSKETSRHSKISSKKPSLANLLPRLPRKLTCQELEAAICGPKRNFTNNDKNQNISLYDGYLPSCQSRVLIKVFMGKISGILEAEKTSAVSMQHKYILELIGYYESCEDCAVLVYPFVECWGNLDEYLTGSGETDQLKLTFEDKLNMAIKIAEGIRYLHEECPGGPVVHGDLQPINIFLTFNFRPLISGFGKAKWLHLKRGLQITPNRFT
ncbi:hypothetical protein F2P56_024888 [Juglans regia]|uniref:Protein kinase domain-containing protein n=1 Tax=Juglans regia TaxID=51240 RepID=A0A833UIF6_JUGRE|nr:hypothetical protein F2P56_024888 [Juglans regia]